MPLYGQYLCEGCLRPIARPGKCDSCTTREVATIRAGNYCDHCFKNGTEARLWLNIKTRTRYCDECKIQFRAGLIWKGAFSAELADRILQTDFIPINDPTKKIHMHRRERKKPDPIE